LHGLCLTLGEDTASEKRERGALSEWCDKRPVKIPRLNKYPSAGQRMQHVRGQYRHIESRITLNEQNSCKT
jgi:hypothetical protein